MKRLIVCCDGTWNRRDAAHPTNVMKFHDWLAERSTDGVPQRAVHFDGVGTRFGERILGGMTGFGLSERIREAYLFLVLHYDPGDELFFFGYSRGAYTVRSLAGLVRKAGLLKRMEHTRLDEAYRLYRSGVQPDESEASEFRERFSHAPRIRCIGVWDTVGALGIPTDWAWGLGLNRSVQFHDVDLSTSVDHAYQALAIDERRKVFRPAVWNQQKEKLARQGIDQVMEQAWFPGIHSDIGGGRAETGLSDHALLWMRSRAERVGLAFRPEASEVPPGFAPDYRIVINNSRGPLFGLWEAHNRPIGKHSEEGLHETAQNRHATDASYRPPELVKYLKRGDPRIFSDT